MNSGQKIGNYTVLRIKKFSVFIRSGLRMTLIRPKYKIKGCDKTTGKGIIVFVFLFFVCFFVPRIENA